MFNTLNKRTLHVSLNDSCKIILDLFVKVSPLVRTKDSNCLSHINGRRKHITFGIILNTQKLYMHYVSGYPVSSVTENCLLRGCVQNSHLNPTLHRILRATNQFYDRCSPSDVVGTFVLILYLVFNR